MSDFFLAALLSISSVFFITDTPANKNFWDITHIWSKTENGYKFEAVNKNISDTCSKNPNYSIELPEIIHGVHELYQNNRLIYQSGDPSFKTSSVFYGKNTVSCKLIEAKSDIVWKVYSYSKYFARFQDFPLIIEQNNFSKNFSINLNLISIGALWLLCLFSYYLFWHRMDRKNLLSLITGAISFSIYSMMCIAPELNIHLSMLIAHKTADIFLYTGALFYFYVLHRLGFLSIFFFKAACSMTIISLAIIILGSTGDVIQFGTSLNLPVVGIILSTILYNSFRQTIQDRSNKLAWLSFSSVLIFVSTSTSDIFHVFGIIDSYMIVPIGAVAGMILLALSANQEIEFTYKERDELLTSLEAKVDQKTKDLSTALENLKKSQAELVLSAKLASLGTLSAGIAHEINNSINFVNGAIVPLEKKVMKLIPETEKASLSKLFAAAKHGTDLTVQIVRSLRSFTGLNQATFKDVSVEEVIKSVLTILKSKTQGIQINVNVTSGTKLYGSQVGISQVLMNIITNAIDALPKDNPQISIDAFESQGHTYLEIKDNGCGMSTEVSERIFDPFYTTKSVGQGTGLGLFIVKKEIDKHNGSITVHSSLNQGTQFKIIIPTSQENILVEQERSVA